VDGEVAVLLLLVWLATVGAVDAIRSTRGRRAAGEGSSLLLTVLPVLIERFVIWRFSMPSVQSLRQVAKSLSSLLRGRDVEGGDIRQQRLRLKGQNE
jgi:hypothetical protein